MYFKANFKLCKGIANSNGKTFHKLTFVLNRSITRFAHMVLEITGKINATKENGSINNLAESTEYGTERTVNNKQK